MICEPKAIRQQNYLRAPSQLPTAVIFAPLSLSISLSLFPRYRRSLEARSRLKANKLLRRRRTINISLPPIRPPACSLARSLRLPILFKRSANCGKSWSVGERRSRSGRSRRGNNDAHANSQTKMIDLRRRKDSDVGDKTADCSNF